MARDGKFGMFGGVFTPSILTILGVIMYLRLPWVVGNAGLYVGLAVVVVAHVVSVSTGLSVSSIATDKKVGAGGPYYIISRSFGLPIGGAIGLALFLGLSFSISLYVIGFSESLLPYAGFEPSATNIRLAGTATIVALTIITFISTSLAIRMQYVILLLIALSLASIFLGDATTEAPLTSAPEGGAGFAVLFGIFFPAVTGFTAGVNMSGDLRDPKRAIPKGTMLAIAAGFFVYAGLAVFLAARVDPVALREDPQVLQNMSLWGPMVVAGVWGATLSSALGSILGAPRILQAMSRDQITPRVFAKGYGRTQEPRNALLLAFAIGEAGILIAELDVIARVVSMVFLAMYGSVNLACVIESWASPDFRPTFRIPRLVSVVGAVTCFLLMVQLDVVAMLGSTVLMLLAFLSLKRRQLSLESGDTWEGVWASVVRVALYRLHRVTGQQRNWRPNILLFDELDHPKHGAIRAFAGALASGNGVATDFRLTDKRVPDESREGEDDHTGLFDQTIVSSEPFETIRSLSQHHGFSGLAPNTLLLPWRWHRGQADEYFRSLRTAARAGLNVLLFEAGTGVAANAEATDSDSPERRIDVWWWPRSASFALSVALARFITRSPGWERVPIRFLLVGTGIDDEDQMLRARAVDYVTDARLEASVRVIPSPSGGASPHELVLNTSRDAAMCLVGLPRDLENADVSLLERLEQIAAMPGGVVFLRSNKAFPRVLQVSERQERTDVPDSGGTIELDALDLEPIDQPDLARAANGLYKQVGAVASRWHEQFAARSYQWHAAICDDARALVEQRYDALMEAVKEPNLAKRRARANRGTSKFFAGAESCLLELAGEGLKAQTSRFADQLSELLEDDALFPDGATELFAISRPKSDFAPRPTDTRRLKRWKASRRRRNFYRRRISQDIHLRTLARFYQRELVGALAPPAVRQFQHDSYELAVEIGRVLTVADRLAVAHLNRQVTSQSAELDVSEMLEKAREATLAQLSALRTHSVGRIDESRREVARHASAVLMAMSKDLARIDVDRLIGAERRPPPLADRGELAAASDRFDERMEALLARAVLSVRIAAVRHQLTVTAVRTLEQLNTGVRSGVLQLCKQVHAQLVARRDGTAQSTEQGGTPLEPSFDGAPEVVRFAHAVAPMSAELPEVESAVSDAVVLALSQSDVDDLDTVALNVRAGLQALIETELISPLELVVARFGELQSSVWGVVRDAVRLADAHVADDDVDIPEEEGDGDAADRVAGTLSHSIDRVEAEMARVEEFLALLDSTVMDALTRLAEATGMLSLSGSLSRVVRRRQPKKPSRVAALARRVRAGARMVAARAMYRRSRARARIDTLEQLRGVVARAQVDPNVRQQLPPYYEHLFMGGLNINDAFFVGREHELKLGRRALVEAAPGQPRVVLITGDRGSGKTALARRLIASIRAPSVWVSPSPRARPTSGGFRGALAAALGGRGKPARLLAAAAPGTTVVIDELDLWWERHTDGLAAVDEMVALIRGAPSEVRFVLAGSELGTRLLDHVRPLSRLANAHLRCEPLSAQQIRDVVMLRHTSTGFRMHLGGADEDSITEWSLARLFHSHFEYSKGNVSSSLHAWIAHIDRVSGDLLHVRRPIFLDWDVLGALRPDLVALLVELLLHKYASAEKLERITNLGASELREAVAELRGFGIVSEYRRGIYQLDPQVHLPVNDWLKRRGLA